MFFKHWIVILMLILILFLSLVHGHNSREGLEAMQSVSDFYNVNKSLHDTIIANTKSLRISLRDYRKSIIKTQVMLRNQQLRSSLPREAARSESAFSKQIVLNMPQVKSIDAIIGSLQNLYTRYNVANISTIDQYKSMFLDIKKSMTEIIANNYMPDFTTRAQGINVKIDDLVKNVDKRILSDKTLKAMNDIHAAQDKSICAVDLNPDLQYLIKDCYTSAVELSTQFIIMKPGEVEHVLYVYDDGKITENCRNNDCRLGDSLLIKYYIAFLPLFVMCPGSILVDTEIINYGFSLTQADIVNKTAVYTKYIDDLNKLVAFISSIKVAVEVSKGRLFLGGSSYDDYVKYTESFIGKITFLKETLSRELNMKNISIPVPVNQAVFGRE
jgi:hypothetical protein